MSRGLASIIRRDFSITRSYRLGFVLDVFFGIMNLVVFYFISEAVALRNPDVTDAPSYFSFAAVGLVLIVVIQSATVGLARRVREEQLTGTLEVLVMQPVTPVQLAIGLTGFPFLFGIVRGAFYISFAAVFMNLGVIHASWPGAFLVLAASGLALSSLGIALGALVLVFKQGEALAVVATFGLGLLSGALFPLGLLPGWLQPLGDILPTTFALDGMRHALFQGTGWQGDLASILISAAVLLPISIWLFSRMLEVVKKSGSLSQY